MNTCVKCGNVLYKALYNNELVLVCKKCETIYRSSSNNTDILMTKCQYCNMWFSKESQNSCNCRMLN